MTLNEAVALIRRANRIAIATHVSPDPDAIGSLLGLGLALRAMGKRVALLCDDPVPDKLVFLPGSAEIRSRLPDHFSADLFIGLDASDPERLGIVSQPLIGAGIPIISIDHHITNTRYGTVNLVLPECAATAEIIVLLLDELSQPLSQETATCLLAGLVGDTRSFSTASVTPATFAAAGRLVAAGADLESVTERVFNRRTVDLLRLWGIGLTHMHQEDGILWAELPLKEQKQLHLERMSDTGLSNLLLSVEGVAATAVFTELPDSKVEISFRARPGLDVSQVAFTLGGGGHPAASGCTVEGSLEEVVQRVLALLKEQVVRNKA
jgi:phosphoesterase RecJ-like protein